MTLKEQISKDHLIAFKAGDKIARNLLGTIKGDIQTNERKGGAEKIDDAAVIVILTKFRKNIKILLDTKYTSELERELDIIEGYLPKSLTEFEIRTHITDAIENGADNIGAIMQVFKGLTVDRSLVSRLAKERLNQVS